MKQLYKDALLIIDDFKISPEERLATAADLAKYYKPDMEAVCEIDLHCHSFYSDGYYSPTNKVFEAYRRKMKAIAISDHDLFDGQLETIKAGDIFGVEVIPAIEFYTDRPGIEIIGHFPNINKFLKLLSSGITKSVIDPIREAKNIQLVQMVSKIPKCFAQFSFNAEITDQDIVKYLRNGMSTKGDISVAMWQKYGNELYEKGLADDVKDFHSKYTIRDSMINIRLDLDMDLSPEAFIKRIVDWGGLPGLPHPTELRKKEGLGICELRKTIERLGLAGLQSIEVDGWRNGICPESGIAETELLDSMRKEYNDNHKDKLPLLFTNGSDDHNQPGEGLELGCGKDGNLSAIFGQYSNIQALKRRQEIISI